MRPRLLAAGLALLGLGALPAPAMAADSAPGEVIVRFESGADASEREAARESAEVDHVETLPVPGLQLVEAEAGQTTEGAVEDLERSGDVEYAEPNFYRRRSALPSDPRFPSLWGLNNVGQSVGGSTGTADADIDAPEAWDLQTASSAVTTAVVDSGVASTHPDLSTTIWRNPGETGSGKEANGADDDRNGLVDDWRGWDWVEDDNLPDDANGHGTHVAGTVAARAGDGVGVAGVAYGSRVMPLRMLDADGSGTVSDLVSAYRYASAKGAQIVNASLGGSAFSRAELDAINAAPRTLFVVAAGNGGDDGVGDNVETTPEYPCAYAAANIVCVGATDQRDRPASFSNYGPLAVDLAAPGTQILSSVPASGYSLYSGTSMATPHTAGVAALLFSLRPTATVAEVRTALLAGAEPKTSLVGRAVTGGRLNAERSLRSLALATGLPPLPDPPAVPPVGSLLPLPDPDSPRGIPSQEPAGTAAKPGTAPPATKPRADSAAPRTRLRVVTRRSLRTVRRRGLRVRVRCSEGCRATLRLVMRRGGRRVLLARRVVRLRQAGTKVATLKLSRRGRAAVRSLRVARTRLSAVAVDGSGNARRTSLRVVLRR